VSNVAINGTFAQVTVLQEAICKTVALRYVGSNPTPATAAKMAFDQRQRCPGAVLVCPTVSDHVW
jgi:hypothetical protein